MGNDVLDGGAGKDLLVGDSGNDVLVGGLGDDTLVGGAGADQFSFQTGRSFDAGAGVDRIVDFQRQDKIVLSKTTFTALTSSNGKGFSLGSEFAIVTTNAAAATSAAVIVYNRTTGSLFYNANAAEVGLGSGNLFATLTQIQTPPLVTAQNFTIKA
ncbi:MAG: hypothetical protein HC881_15655 [Leptolyngbyaceae cyanobacterium SL_7_1]|nr:hypothetical protein [Leptolyngbyaceae cyanobacterium SL_7_1]